ncbi:MAG: DUF6174 domain-containing protein [Gemmatimonadota bacterium]|nr:DUF6174 domain-containing protein [Gemmatimonadota bacterium]
MRRIFTTAALAGSLGLAGCGISGPGIDDLAELNRNRARWAQVRPAAYEYAVERLCFCALEGPVRMLVTGSQASGHRFVDSGDPVPVDQREWYPTVEGLFDVVADAFGRDAFEVDVTYDPDTGVPVEIFIDYEQNVADEELGFRVTEAPSDASVPTGG